MKATALKEYKKKRNFSITPEPSPQIAAASKKEPVFVVQKHAASRLHYDFRIEVGGVLKSWAVPKGPSRSTKVKRLAVLTEDHPMKYATFKGIIPKGQYGGGKVIIWDTGTYENLKKKKDGTPMSMDAAFKRGHVEVILKGKKLRGGFALTRFQGPKNWLMVKMRALHQKKHA